MSQNTEQYLARIANGEGPIPPVPTNPEEQYLQYIATGEGELPKVPTNFKEAMLAKIAENGGGGTSGLSESVKQALLQVIENVAYTTPNGESYYQALYDALYPSAPPAELVSISAVFTQGNNVVYDTDSLDTLKQYLVVTATYDDSTTANVSAYTLSGTLAVGTSTITVSYGGKTTTFNVTVTHDAGHSDMTGWADGIAYTNLEIVNDEYAQASDGAILQYSGWNRTGYVPCHGASTLTVPPLPQTGNARATSSWFYDENHNPVSGGLNGFELSKTQPTTVTVPSGAYYFIISSEASALATCVNNGIVPNA